MNIKGDNKDNRCLLLKLLYKRIIVRLPRPIEAIYTPVDRQ